MAGMATLTEGISKTLQSEGTGPKATGSCEVVVKVIREDEEHIVEGLASNMQILTWPARTSEICVTSMSQSEKASFRLSSDPNLVQLELLEVKALQECGHFQEKTGEKNFPKMTQKWLLRGHGAEKPLPLSTVTARVDGELLAWCLLTSPTACLECVECAVLHMTQGGRCEVLVDGANPVTVELLDFERMPASSQLSPSQKLQRSERLKMSGTAFMQSQDFRRACRTYQLAQDFLGYVKDWEQEERHHAEMLRKACKSNEVMAWIKLEQFREALDLCTEILEGGGGMEAEPSDHKALYRRGLSYLALGEAEGAKEDFRKLLALDPMNKEAKAQLVKCRELEKAQAKKSEELLKGMIGAAGDFGYPMGCSTVEGQREREREAMLDRLEELKAQGPWVL